MASLYKTKHLRREDKPRRMQLVHGVGVRSEDRQVFGWFALHGRGTGVEIEMSLAELKKLHADLGRVLGSKFVKEHEG